MNEQSEKDINERLNNGGDIMKELTEEEMKCEGGACMRTARKSGYIQISTGGRPGDYRIKDAGNISQTGKFIINSWCVLNQGGGSIGRIIDKVWADGNSRLWAHTSTGRGWCEIGITYTYHGSVLNINNQQRYTKVKIQFIY